uniref:F-box domain-containing protein n=1 Tax=Oryza glaberrima TaxID=4538 RepID=I1P2Y8_ORYGL
GAEDGAGLAAAAPATAAANLEAYGTGPCSCTAGHCGGGPCSGGGDDSCGRGAARMSPPVRRRLQKRSPSSSDEHPCGGASKRRKGRATPSTSMDCRLRGDEAEEGFWKGGSEARRKRQLAAVKAELPPDALGALHVEVLDNIVDRLHIYEVVRTSVLSCAWWGCWESLPFVDLTWSPDVAASDVDVILLRRSATDGRYAPFLSHQPQRSSAGSTHSGKPRASRTGRMS